MLTAFFVNFILTLCDLFEHVIGIKAMKTELGRYMESHLLEDARRSGGALSCVSEAYRGLH